MSVIKAFCVAFSIYSKIPMPHFEWKEEELRYHLIFFPFVGAVIGALLYLWYLISVRFGIGRLMYTFFGTAIPLMVTGGFHVDGFMDTTDALKSYKSGEEKLEILKDPHIGAFSVIMLAVAGLIYTASYEGIYGKSVIIFAIGFAVSRALSGIAVIKFPKAKKKGMLSTFSDSCEGHSERRVLCCLIAELFALTVAAVLTDVKSGICMIVTFLFAYIYYYLMSKKEFGGITGDTAGYFVTVSECMLALVLYVVCLI